MEFGKDDFLEEFGNVREEGNSTVVGWISSLVFIFRYWHDVTELEDCRDMAGGDYGIEEISQEFACQGTRVNDVLWIDSIWARGLVRFKALNGFLDLSAVMGISSPTEVSRRARYSSLMDCWKSESYVLWGEGTPSCSK